jgi:hypothetical protein
MYVAGWLFLGSSDGAEVNTTFSTLIASCHLNNVEPEQYLRAPPTTGSKPSSSPKLKS